MQKPGDLPGRYLQLSNASRKGVQAAVEFSLLRKVPSPACRFRVAERSAGFCLFSIRIRLCVSVVNLPREITTETQRTTEITQRGPRVERYPFTPSARL